MNFPKFTFAAVCLSLSLAACSTIPTPNSVANSTKLDERMAISAELTYTTATKLGTLLAKAELIDGGKFRGLDNQAYMALLAVRRAYQAGNSSDYNTAVENLQSAVSEINGLAREETVREP